MTSDTGLPRWRDHQLARFTPTIMDQFESVSKKNPGLRTLFLEREVLASSAVQVGAEMKLLRRIHATETVDYKADDAGLREVVIRLVIAGVNQLNHDLAKELQAVSAAKLQALLAAKLQQGGSCSPSTTKTWHEAIEAAKKGPGFSDAESCVLLVSQALSKGLSNAKGSCAIVGASDNEHDKSWPELIKRWTGHDPCVVGDAELVADKKAILVVAPSWRTTLYVGSDWKLFADPLDCKIQLRVEIEFLPVVTSPASVDFVIAESGCVGSEPTATDTNESN